MVAGQPRGAAQCRSAVDRRVRPALLFCLSVHQCLVVPGLGIQPPTADWGSMVRDNAVLITFGDVSPLLPALAVALITVSVNLVVDWVLHTASGLKEC